MAKDITPIRMCVCHEKSFQELKESGLATVSEIADRYGCTTGCGLCRPYIEQMLKTGQVAFALISENLS